MVELGGGPPVDIGRFAGDLAGPPDVANDIGLASKRSFPSAKALFKRSGESEVRLFMHS